ncbi:toll/interleukin-1 receptor domain-containing protein [Roseibacillus persicicus]|uniref:TIR domain-containing protein n=1 Tax=Roseibacillus persicicus TaxID=454148 RepID=A0A918TSB0_9BACT|nr:toll/interleukin-1 receptor domain-containing protein [Roseibacillus persicicus]GHC59883.1 hypothetical protein GCM10007100_28940 [Roseibacillus persicicus]
MSSLFFSYSHVDETLRNELQKHLTMLERSGTIQSWHDRCIKAGDELDPAISTELENADVILLLVSPDFLASRYCYELEMTRAMERHQEGSARVIPVILRPCDWTDAPFGKLLAAPKDGKAITLWPDRDSALLDVTRQIKDALPKTPSQPKSQSRPTSEAFVIPTPASPVQGMVRSSNLSVRQNFTQADKDRFLEESFDYISLYFKNTLQELQDRYEDIETRHKAIDATCFFSEIYRNGDSVAKAYIHHGGASLFGGGIVYGTSPNRNTINESLNVEVGEQSLGLKPMGMAMAFHTEARKGALTQQGAAEYFWSILIAPLQR